jgi:hypothetical protein
VYVRAKNAITVRGTFKRLGLPHYGDEQFAVGASLGPFAAGVVFARSGNRVWEVVVSGYPHFSKARLSAELRKYAAKEKARAT